MSQPPFYVIARVIGAKNSFKKWEEILVHLCKVSLTEPQGRSYYWGRDLDGEPDTIWGLEGYTEADGFNYGHPSSDIFKAQMERIHTEKLLGQDYDLHHYNLVGGWLKRPLDPQADSKTSHVAVLHFYTREGIRDQVIEQLEALGKEALENVPSVSSFGILKGLNDENLVTVWLRTPTSEDFEAYCASKAYGTLIGRLKNGGDVERMEVHQSKTFNGHLEK